MENVKDKKSQEVKILAGEYASMKGYNNRVVFAAKKIFKNEKQSMDDWNTLFVKKGLIDKK